MDKVKLPREVAEAIDKLRGNGWKDNDLVNTVEFISPTWKPVISTSHMGYPVAKYLSEKNFVSYASAIIIGYEVEQTPEEKVRDYFDKQYSKLGTYSQDNSAYAIRNTLDLLGIKIEGVNT